MQYKNYSKIRLITDKYSDEGVTIGAIGYIIEIWKKPNLAYALEFSDEKGITIALFSALPAEIELLENA
jgi:hypothetical protein